MKRHIRGRKQSTIILEISYRPSGARTGTVSISARCGDGTVNDTPVLGVESTDGTVNGTLTYVG